MLRRGRKVADYGYKEMGARCCQRAPFIRFDFLIVLLDGVGYLDVDGYVHFSRCNRGCASCGSHCISCHRNGRNRHVRAVGYIGGFAKCQSALACKLLGLGLGVSHSEISSLFSCRSRVFECEIDPVDAGEITASFSNIIDDLAGIVEGAYLNCD